ALEATRALQRIAAKESRVFDPAVAEPALVTALNHHASEEVRIAAGRVLALLNTPTAQTAIAAVALAAEQTATLRMAAFGSLAESARYLGNRLNEQTTKELIKAATSEPNLDLRTAASQALGSTINMPAELAVEAILGGARGG
ncbi:MAG: HEAT repeat domain-containing protein, partial [Planctomycetes bacterium]|nr:HEAT repeat domain-containing protein [Planctomycetota bacterium]